MQDVKEQRPIVLVVAEKPRMARDIAQKLSPNGRYRTVLRPRAKKSDRKYWHVTH